MLFVHPKIINSPDIEILFAENNFVENVPGIKQKYFFLPSHFKHIQYNRNITGSYFFLLSSPGLFQQGRGKNGKIFTELILSPPLAYSFSFLHQGEGKNGKNVFSSLNFYFFSPTTYFFYPPFSRVNFAKYT